MPSQWDHRADKDLLLTIIEAGNLTHIEWHAVAGSLKTKGYNFSHEACRQHYQKIRKESKTSQGKNNSSTPARATSTSKGTPASRKRKQKAVDHEDDDEEDLSVSPSIKRQKSIKKEEETEPTDMCGFIGQTAAQFKMEPLNGDDGSNVHAAIDLDDDALYEA